MSVAGLSEARPLVARSAWADVADDLLARLPVSDGVAFVRDGAGLVGWGEHARLVVDGPDRFARAAAWWRSVAAGLVVEDEVETPGSGPVLFGSFSFADTEPSVLVVPQVVAGRRGGRGWLTTIGPAAPVPAVGERAAGPGPVRYSSGAMSMHDYRRAVVRATARIRAGELEKVVLSHDLLATTDRPIDTRPVLRSLAAAYPHCWTFCVDGLLGATPELLLRRHGDAVSSRVLAGTVARAGAVHGDDERGAGMLSSAKLREEHEYAARSVVAALRPLCSDVTVADPEVLRLANVQHLSTDVRGRLRSPLSALDLVSALHPTAAVGGTPTDVALALIAELEGGAGMRRGRYAGPIGWVDARGDGEWGLALRCAQVAGSTARLYAGGGIVADSDPDEEVREAQAKFVPVRDALEAAANVPGQNS